jgi:hypothetical protein
VDFPAEVVQVAQMSGRGSLDLMTSRAICLDGDRWGVSNSWAGEYCDLFCGLWDP